MKNLKKNAFASVLITLILVLSAATTFQAVKAAATPVATSSPALSSKEIWNFTAADTTAHATSLEWASPVVANGIAYVWNTETYIITGEPLDPFSNPIQHTLGAIYALNASSGAKLWNFTTPGTVISLNIVNGIVYVCSNDYVMIDGQSAGANIYSLDAFTGAQNWAYNCSGQARWSSISDGVIYTYVQSSGVNCYIYAVKMTTGEELWKWNAGYDVWLSNPAFNDDAIYFGTFDGGYYAINTANGTVRWSVATGGGVRDFSIATNGVVYLNSDHTAYSVNNTYTYLFALNGQNGDKLWSFPLGYVGSTPKIEDGVVYVDGRQATLTNPYTLSAQMQWGASSVFALNASDGDKVWNYSSNDMNFSPLTLTADAVYFSSNGTINALNAANGMQLWNCSNAYNGPYMPFTINGGMLYYYSGQTLYALNASSGNSLWNYTTPNVQSFLTVANNTAFLDAGNTVYALNLPTPALPEANTSFSSTGLILVLAAVAITTLGLIALAAKKLNRTRSVSK